MKTNNNALVYLTHFTQLTLAAVSDVCCTGDGENSIRIFASGLTPPQSHKPHPTAAETPQTNLTSSADHISSLAAAPANITTHTASASASDTVSDTIMQDSAPQTGTVTAVEKELAQASTDLDLGGPATAPLAGERWRMVACKLQASSQDVNCVRWQPRKSGRVQAQQGQEVQAAGQGGSLLASAGDDGFVRLWRVVVRA